MITTYETRDAARKDLTDKGYWMSNLKPGVYVKAGYRATIHPIDGDIKVRVVIEKVR